MHTHSPLPSRVSVPLCGVASTCACDRRDPRPPVGSAPRAVNRGPRLGQLWLRAGRWAWSPEQGTTSAWAASSPRLSVSSGEQ